MGKKKSDRIEALLKNPELLKNLLDQVVTKIKAHREPLTAAKEQLLILTRLVRAWVEGRYRDVPWRSLAMIAGALIYFLNPFDLIPDFIAGGFLDDLAVLSTVAGSVKADMDAFLSWESGKQVARSE